MASRKYLKRYFDAHMHRDPKFRALPWKLREAWRVLLGECDFLGIWPLDLDSLKLYVGTKIALEELQQHFKIEDAK